MLVPEKKMSASKQRERERLCTRHAQGEPQTPLTDSVEIRKRPPDPQGSWQGRGQRRQSVRSLKSKKKKKKKPSPSPQEPAGGHLEEPLARCEKTQAAALAQIPRAENVV